MPLYYGVILPKELFWTTLAEAYIKKTKNKKRTFDKPISEFLYLLSEEFGENDYDLNDKDINNIKENALNILDKDEWNFDEVLFEGIYHIKLPKNYRFLGYKIETVDDAFYILDNVEFDTTEIDEMLKDKGFKNFKPQICFSDLTLYGGEILDNVDGLNLKNKI